MFYGTDGEKGVSASPRFNFLLCMPSLSFSRENRLKSSFLIRKTFHEGIKTRGKFVSIFWLSLPEEKRLRFTVIVGSKVSRKAVVRNRMKRVLRAAFVESIRASRFENGLVVISVYRVPEDITYARAAEELTECLAKLHSLSC